jgi:activating signal cointegrator 1
MKCLSLRQPWATLIVGGFTSCDVRSWCTAHRGLLAIHASQKWNDHADEICRRPSVRQWLQAAGFPTMFDLPRGQILGVVELIDCLVRPDRGNGEPGAMSARDERTGRFIWKLAGPRPLAEPVAWQAKRGVFDIPDWWQDMGQTVAAVWGSNLPPVHSHGPVDSVAPLNHTS